LVVSVPIDSVVSAVKTMPAPPFWSTRLSTDCGVSTETLRRPIVAVSPVVGMPPPQLDQVDGRLQFALACATQASAWAAAGRATRSTTVVATARARRASMRKA
jgi:hypothetical protein